MRSNEAEGSQLPEALVLERLDEATLDWFHRQRRALAAARGEPAPATPEDTRCWLEQRPEAVEQAQGEGDWIPFLHRYLGGVASEALERALIEAGAIRAAGFRYVQRR